MAYSADTPGLKYASHQYGQHNLQRVGVWQYENAPEAADSAPSYWIMYVTASQVLYILYADPDSISDS